MGSEDMIIGSESVYEFKSKLGEGWVLWEVD